MAAYSGRNFVYEGSLQPVWSFSEGRVASPWRLCQLWFVSIRSASEAFSAEVSNWYERYSPFFQT